MGSNDEAGAGGTSGKSLEQQIEELKRGRRKPANFREFVDQKMAEDAQEESGEAPGTLDANDDK